MKNDHESHLVGDWKCEGEWTLPQPDGSDSRPCPPESLQKNEKNLDRNTTSDPRDGFLVYVFIADFQPAWRFFLGVLRYPARCTGLVCYRTFGALEVQRTSYAWKKIVSGN